MPAIKLFPEDFFVEEVIEIKHKKNDCLVFTLEKRNENTIDAIKKIAGVLGVPIKNFGYAGLKDKNAVTRQKVSVKGVKKEELEIELKNIKIMDIERGDRIRIGDHLGNKFRIVVREVGEIKEIKKEFPNFFGEQRFGGNERIGRNIIKEKYEDAVKEILKKEGMEEEIENEEFEKIFERYPDTYEKKVLRSLIRKKDYLKALRSLPSDILTLYIHSYQSFIFNELLKKRLERLELGEIEEGDIISTEIFGKKAYVKVNSSNITEAKKKRYSPVLPIVGYKTRVYGNTKEDLGSILEREEIDPGDFKIKSIPFLSSRGTYREIIGKCENLEWKLKDRNLICKFFLPKGEYATVFMEQIFKRNITYHR
ncbi:MAG: tRNA pseudouridine(13) synthase TruD [Methanomicrobia archaeon]|nr:tRNA pseudouridine(13) synthase TruD [Methanomicrobia archaeon]